MTDTIIVRIVKNKCGNLCDSNNYKPIALATIMSKLFKSIILNVKRFVKHALINLVLMMVTVQKLLFNVYKNYLCVSLNQSGIGERDQSVFVLMLTIYALLFLHVVHLECNILWIYVICMLLTITIQCNTIIVSMFYTKSNKNKPQNFYSK